MEKYRCGVRGKVKGVNAADMRPAEAKRQLDLPLKPRDDLGITGNLRPDRLQRDTPQLKIDSLVDFTHPAASDQPYDPEAPEDQLAFGERRLCRREQPVKINDRSITVTDRVLVGTQQSEQGVAQFKVLAADLIDVPGAPFFRLLHGRSEEGLEPLPTFGRFP